MKRIHLEIVLGTILIFLSTMILTKMSLDENARLEEFKVQQAGEQVEFGAAVYHINCTSCHGEYAQGVLGKGPCLRCPDLFDGERLDAVGWSGTTEDYIIATVTTGKYTTRPAEFMGNGDGIMPTWGDEFGGPLRPDQIRAVAAFIMNFQEWGENPGLVPTPMVVVDSDDPVAVGRALFAGIAGCAACHTVDGLSAGTVGPVLDGLATRAETTVDGLSAEEYIRQSILDPSAFIVEGFENTVDPAVSLMPANFADILSEDDINNLVAFMLSLTE